MIDLKDVTFNIPVKIDSRDRLNNLKLSINLIKSYFDTNILVCEQEKSKCKNVAEKHGVKYLQLRGYPGLVYKTKMLNIMANNSDTPYIALHDTDVISNAENYLKAVEYLRNNEAQVALPYSGTCYDVPKKFHKNILKEKSLESVGDIRVNGTLMNPIAVGGVVFFDRQAFIEGGMANENFKSWGWEDIELITRFEILGYQIKKVDGILYHLEHKRTPDSSVGHKYHKKNEKEFRRIKRLNKIELRKEVEKWEWLK